MKSPKIRLDALLVEQGLVETRSQAQGLVLAGKVLVEGKMVDKPGTMLRPETAVELKEKNPYVSRGGLKLAGALEAFGIDVTNRVCIDVGASTGGFTDCLLQKGASHVHSLDVGYGQLDWKLRQHPQVTVWEKTHILKIDPQDLKPAPELAVVDVSFISFKKVLLGILGCLATDKPEIIALIKPQFEYLDYCQAKGFDGVVKDPAHHVAILKGLSQDIAELAPNLVITHVDLSPIKGPKGNIEFFFRLVTEGSPVDIKAYCQSHFLP